MQMKLTHKVSVAAHRGDSCNYYENTMEAFEAAIREGVDMIETDVHLTKDLEMVLIHDHTLDRTTDARGPVKDMDLAEIRKLNAGSPQHYCQIPTLRELLELLSGTDVLLNLEFKEYYEEGNEERCELCVDKAVELLEEFGFTDRMVFNSFDAHVLEYIDRKYKGRGYLLHGFYPYDRMSHVERDPAEYLYCACVLFRKNTESFEFLKEHGIEAWFGCSVVCEDMMDFYAKNGAKLITTNDPADTIRKLEARGWR